MDNTVRDKIAKLISSMIFISETEAGLDLFDWADVHNLHSLKQKIAALTSTPVTAQVFISPHDFLNYIQKSADPKDEVMVRYAESYTHLFSILSSSLTGLCVIRVGRVVQHLFIAGFQPAAGCIGLYTTATET